MVEDLYIPLLLLVYVGFHVRAFSSYSAFLSFDY